MSTSLQKGGSCMMPFLGVSVRPSPDEVSVWTCEHSQVDVVCERAPSSRTKRKKRKNLLLAFCLPCTEPGVSIFSCSWTEMCTISDLGSQAFQTGAESHCRLSWMPGCRRQIMSLFSLQNRASSSWSVYVSPPFLVLLSFHLFPMCITVLY